MTWRVEGMFCPHCEQTILGALGSAFSLSSAMQAAVQLFAAAFMLLMALNLLGCFHFLPKIHLP